MGSIDKFVELWARLGRAAQQQNRARLALLPRFLSLYGAGRYSPNEIFRLELLAKPVDRLPDYISKERLLRIQRRLNPVELTSQTEDKAVFQRVCLDAGLPIPALLADVDLKSPEVARGALAGIPDGDAIAKPALGYHGLGVLPLSVRDGRFKTTSGETLDISGVLARLAQTPRFTRWLVQRRVVNHPDVEAISPSSALQTLRVVTFVDDAGVAHIIASQWRLARPEAVKDNFDAGFEGNALCNVDVSTGRIITALRLAPGGTRMEPISSHPVSRVELAGLPVPFWSAVEHLAKQAALAMLPTRSIGWDIAVTPTGPVIIEANRYWDPQNMDGGMGARLRFMAARTTVFSYT